MSLVLQNTLRFRAALPTGFIIDYMGTSLPLPTLLSQALVAFIIEFDNEFEHRVPHRTSNHGWSGSPISPWLVSMAMWTKFLRFVPDEGLSVAEFQRLTGAGRAAAAQWLTRLSEWWGYLAVEQSGADRSKRPGPSDMVRLTSGGIAAVAVWRPLTATIERRWEGRFGGAEVDRLRELLTALAGRLDPGLPNALPILGYGLLSHCESAALCRAATEASSWPTLPDLLSKALLAFALEFERESILSMAICANVLRVLVGEGVHLRDLPRLSGVSKEAVAMGLGILKKCRCVTERPESPGSRARLIALTADGLLAQEAYRHLVRAIERRWNARHGEKAVAALRGVLERIVGDPASGNSPLFLGLEPHPEGWRAAAPRREVLPHFPMILHRGGFPDGV